MRTAERSPPCSAICNWHLATPDCVSVVWRRRSRPGAEPGAGQHSYLDDLRACAARTPNWHRAGAATPLLLTRDEFARSLDAFPIEYGEILDTHHVLFGHDPFDGLTIHTDDLRRACEVQVKSHLLHLREDYIECGARRRKSPAWSRVGAGVSAVLRHLARLDDRPARTPASSSPTPPRVPVSTRASSATCWRSPKAVTARP